jgi:hypothetical protein
MAFSDDAAPTRHNISKRLRAAREALASTIALTIAAGDDEAGVREAAHNALGWTMRAEMILRDNKGKRRG